MFLRPITESGNLSLAVSAASGAANGQIAQARGIYDAAANTFVHATVAGGANAVMVSIPATDAGTAATDSVLLIGVYSSYLSS